MKPRQKKRVRQHQVKQATGSNEARKLLNQAITTVDDLFKALDMTNDRRKQQELLDMAQQTQIGTLVKLKLLRDREKKRKKSK